MLEYVALIRFSFTLPSPITNIRFRGRKSSYLREENLWNSLHMSLFHVDMSIFNRVLSAHSPHVIPVLVLLWFSYLLCLVGVLVLSNPVFSSSPPPKPAQDHKVSICITLMCMMISCWCTYCLQEGLMNMKVHFLHFTSVALMHIAKIHVTHCFL